jgi:hypothetical protein
MIRKLLAVAALTTVWPVAMAVAVKSPFKSTGWAWSGRTGAGASVQFSTNPKERKILAGFDSEAANVVCSYNGQTEAPTAFPLSTSKPIAVSGGRFSSTQPGRPAGPLGAPTLKLTGQLKGKNASGTLTWTLASTGGSVVCTPTSGSFTFKAKRGIKLYPGAG